MLPRALEDEIATVIYLLRAPRGVRSGEPSRRGKSRNRRRIRSLGRWDAHLAGNRHRVFAQIRFSRERNSLTSFVSVRSFEKGCYFIALKDHSCGSRLILRSAKRLAKGKRMDGRGRAGGEGGDGKEKETICAVLRRALTGCCRKMEIASSSLRSLGAAHNS